MPCLYQQLALNQISKLLLYMVLCMNVLSYIMENAPGRL